ncbi:hypothetical protein D3C84_993770 [compost metagenome]
MLHPVFAPAVESRRKSTLIDVRVLADFFQHVLGDNPHRLGGMAEAMSDQLQVILIQLHGFGGG